MSPKWSHSEISHRSHRKGWDSNPRKLKASPDFESGTFDHSATLPSDRVEENSGKMENGKEAIETRNIDNGCGQLNGDRQFITKHPFRSRRQITTEATVRSKICG